MNESWTKHIRAWGNSLGLRIPNKIFEQTHFHEDASVEVTVVDANTLQITRTQEDDQ